VDRFLIAAGDEQRQAIQDAAARDPHGFFRQLVVAAGLDESAGSARDVAGDCALGHDLVFACL
jgi:hypothetical protein